MSRKPDPIHLPNETWLDRLSFRGAAALGVASTVAFVALTYLAVRIGGAL